MNGKPLEIVDVPCDVTMRRAIEMCDAEIGEKMEFISDAERDLQDLIEAAVIRLQSEYKEKFGRFTRHDCWLWYNCSLTWPIIWNSGMIMDEEED